MNANTLFKIALFSFAAVSISACNHQSLTQGLSSHFESWSVVPYETAQMKAEKLDKDIDKTPRFEPKPHGHLGAFGLNLETYLLHDNARPAEHRIARLEKSVVELQKDLAILAPTVQTLTAQDRHAAPQQPSQMTLPPANDSPVSLQEKETISWNAKPATLTSEDLISAPHTKKIQRKAAGSIDKIIKTLDQNAPVVQAVRTGVHTGLTRIVFDVSGKTPYRVDLDNKEHILVVEFPGAGWNKNVINRTFAQDRLLKGYKVTSMGNGRTGHIFALQLKKASSIQNQDILPAVSGKGRRIVIDLSS
jgi:hypothetical protein